MFGPAVMEAPEATERFDFSARVDALRTHSSSALHARLAEARRQQQRWHLEELAVLRAMDDRGALGPMPDATVSARTAAANATVARELESLPALAAAAWDGALSWDQLQPAVELATPTTDREWADRAPRISPAHLQRMARHQRVISNADAEARHEAREVRTWRDDHRGMHAGRWALPDVDGVLVDKVLEHMAERMRPAKGAPWDSLAHRKADALVALARNYADTEPTGRFRVEIVNIIDANARSLGPSVEGIPLAPATVRALVPQAKLRDCVVDATGVPRTTKSPRTALPADIERHVRRRDVECRTPGCEETRGLEIHHCDPITTHGDSHDVRRLAGVCPHCHHLYEPHGPYRLEGDAERPDGLRLVHRDDEPRAGPSP